MFSCLLLFFVAYHQFSISSFKIVLFLRKQMRTQKRSEGVRVGRTPGLLVIYCA